jgi:hypothetical protein
MSTAKLAPASCSESGALILDCKRRVAILLWSFSGILLRYWLKGLRDAFCPREIGHTACKLVTHTAVCLPFWSAAPWQDAPIAAGGGF